MHIEYTHGFEFEDWYERGSKRIECEPKKNSPEFWGASKNVSHMHYESNYIGLTEQ